MAADLERALGPAGAAARDGRIGWLRSPCLGRCELAPAALLTVAGEAPVRRELGPDGRRRDPGAASRAAGAIAGSEPEVTASVPQAGSDGLRLLARIGVVDPGSVSDYRAHGGYRALANAIAMGPEATIREVSDAKLVGRGGAAFPTGRKWAAVATQAAQPHYVVCNADESEPGTFKDRVLMEADPFAVVESMTIEGFATGASRGYLYIRGEYPLAEARLPRRHRGCPGGGLPRPGRRRVRLGVRHRAPARCRRLHLRRGDGALRVDRGQARRAAQQAALPRRVRALRQADRDQQRRDAGQRAAHPRRRRRAGGGARYAATGTEGSTGPKLFCLSGHVVRPGVYEVPFGTTLRELLALGGGVPGGRAIRAILLGGAAGVFVGPEALDVPLTFEGTRAIGASLGSGVVMVFDETADLVGTLRRIAAFFRDESCGQCVPCRVGTVRQEELLARLADGAGVGARSREEELVLLAEIGRAMRDASICGLGQTASSAIESALRQPELVGL